MKTGIITGCSRGIGLATATLLSAKAGYKIIGSSTTGEHPLPKPNFHCFKLDLSKSESILDFVRHTKGHTIDFLINNAAVLLEKWDQTAIHPGQLRDTFEVNLFGTIELTELLLPRMAKGGHIINITSEWGSFSEKNFDAYQPHYKLSKAALNMYTKLLSHRLDKAAVTVSSLDPGWTQTDMGGREAPRDPGEVALDSQELLNAKVKTGQFWHRGTIRDW